MLSGIACPAGQCSLTSSSKTRRRIFRSGTEPPWDHRETYWQPQAQQPLRAGTQEHDCQSVQGIWSETVPKGSSASRWGLLQTACSETMCPSPSPQAFTLASKKGGQLRLGKMHPHHGNWSLRSLELTQAGPERSRKHQ